MFLFYTLSYAHYVRRDPRDQIYICISFDTFDLLPIYIGLFEIGILLNEPLRDLYRTYSRDRIYIYFSYDRFLTPLRWLFEMAILLYTLA